MKIFLIITLVIVIGTYGFHFLNWMILRKIQHDPEYDTFFKYLKKYRREHPSDIWGGEPFN